MGAIITFSLVLLVVAQAAMAYGFLLKEAGFAVGGAIATLALLATCMTAVYFAGFGNGTCNVQAQAARMGYGKIAPLHEGGAPEFRWVHGRQGKGDE